MIRILIRYVKFIGTSIVGTLTDMLVLWFMSDFVFKGLYWGEYIVSPVISFQCAVAVNFLISYFYVWRDRTVNAHRIGKIRFWKLYLKYNLSGSAVFLLRLGAIILIERFTGWDVLVCNISAMIFSGLLNFIINNLIIFKRK